MGLGGYFGKRRFRETPEPKGSVKKSKSRRLAFVVQEHHASRLHYDFRLEIDGVLKSWAVPKGPSLNPREHHLAVQTEDHPFVYRTFEGVIPEGNYGAGNVIIWDEGYYEARKGDPADSEVTLRTELNKGHLTFILHGHKLKGEFALIKMPNAREENAWLLVKKSDEYATESDILANDESVKSHRRVDEVAALEPTPPDLSHCPKIAAPWQVEPMLCTLVDEPFDGEGWLFEVKWDGYRVIASKHGRQYALYSRTGKDFAAAYPPVVEALQSLKHDIILDGEIVVVDETGTSHFEWLQNWRRDPHGSLQYYVFDILWYDGRDVRGLPLEERKQLLASVLPRHNVLHYSDHLAVKGVDLFAQMRRRSLEGMVAKRAASAYREGVRGPDWLKIKTQLRQEVVIGGFTEPRGGRKYLGALVVGVYEDGVLTYTGHSGGGIPDDMRRELHQKLLRLERKTSPFVVEPTPNAPVHWVRPELVCEMSFSEWTKEGSMRHPIFEGLRPDKKPPTVAREKVAHTPAVKKAAASTPVEFTHLDKVFFPRNGITKGDLIKYYESVADYILPYLKARPCSMLRMPHGITGESFFQKNNEHLPEWVPHADIFSESNNADLRWIVGGDLPTLLYMVQLGCVEINPWNSRVKQLEHPDWIVIDLDPDTNSFKQVIAIAHTVREVCEEWGVTGYPKTSGKTGLHIFIPLGARYTFEQGRMLAHLIVLEVNKRQPKITSVERSPQKRPGKIYLDYLQNRAGQTLAAPYSVRPTPTATVSAPLHWDEVVPSLKPTDFTIANVGARLARVGDLWQPVMGPGIDVKAILQRLEENG